VVEDPRDLLNRFPRVAPELRSAVAEDVDAASDSMRLPWLLGCGRAVALGISGEPTLTTGSYSGSRIIDAVGFVQTDTPLNFGNSGGPLFNIRGEVVGIVSWGFSDAQGLNFAVAGRDARNLLLSTEIAHHYKGRPRIRSAFTTKRSMEGDSTWPMNSSVRD
jgi:hypothetical protein